METVLNMVIDPDNVRMLLMVVLGWSGFVLIKSSIKELRGDMEVSIKGLRSDMDASVNELKASIKELRGDMEASIKELRGDMEASIKGLRSDMDASVNELKASIKELKYNDIAHLNGSVEALTYALEKNGYLKKEDKEYVDSRLAH